jgi:kynurenine 3-monooxygenase
MSVPFAVPPPPCLGSGSWAHAVTVHHHVQCCDVELLEGGGARLSLQRTTSDVDPEGAGDGCSTQMASFVETTPFLLGADGVNTAVRDAMSAQPGTKTKVRTCPQPPCAVTVRRGSEGERGKQGCVAAIDDVPVVIDRPGAEAMGMRRVQVKRFDDNNARVYKILPLTLPEDWRKDVNYSARTASGINLEAMPTKEGGMVGVVLFKPDNTSVISLKTGEQARKLFNADLPMFAPYISEDDFEQFAQRPVSRLPTFSFCGPSLHHDGTVALVGDAIHTVKPYFGMVRGISVCVSWVLAVACVGRNTTQLARRSVGLPS